MEALDNLKYIKDNRATYIKWKEKQCIKDAQINVLRERGNFSQAELEKASSFGSTLINSIDIMDQLSINRSENALVPIHTALSTAINMFAAIGAGVGYTISELSKNPNKTPKIAAFIGYIVTSLVGVVIGEFFSAHFEKMATRVARYQTREKDLKDVKNFVVYNKSQIEEATKLAKDLPEVKDITQDLNYKESLNPIMVFKNSFQTLKELKDNYSNYSSWHKEYTENEKNKYEKFANMQITQEEKNIAEKERDNLLNTITKLELASNDYEINAGLGIKIATVIISLFSVTSGFLSSWALSRISKKMTQTPIFATIIDHFSKLSIPAGFIGTAFLAGPLVKILKDSTRLGRYKEKNALLKDSTNFISFTDEEKASVKEVNLNNQNLKSPNVIENYKNIWKMKDEIVEFNKYNKKKSQEELKLREALKKVQITEEQEKEARKLQAQTFAVFEKIDDKSESFVDDTNAALNSISTMITGSICTFADILTLKLFGNKISKYTKDNKMPGFWEGLKLTRHLKLKDTLIIFIAPFLVTRLISLGISTIKTELKKYACKIGIMSAALDLEDPRNFII